MINRPARPILAVALDHIPLGLMSGWEDVPKTLSQIVANDADYIVLNYGIIKSFRAILMANASVKLVLRLDASPSYLIENWRKPSSWDLMHSIDDAANLGVSAVIVNIMPGTDVELQSLIAASRIASAAFSSGIKVFISAIPPMGRKCNNVELSAFAARIACEIGADFVNSYFTGKVGGLRRITSVCPVPVILAGGSMKSDENTVLRAHAAVTNGCAGICFGRSIWQSKHPEGVLKALRCVLDSPSSLPEFISRPKSEP